MLQLLDAVSRMASLGFEKSYRETVVLMTRSYLDKLSTVGSAESKTLAPEANTERVEVCNLYIFFDVVAMGSELLRIHIEVLCEGKKVIKLAFSFSFLPSILI